MSSLKVITVLGATGAQGGSVVRSLVGSGRYLVRAGTRNVNSDGAQALLKAHPERVNLVEFNLANPTSVEKAFEGAYGVFAVTNFYQPDILAKPELEEAQGKQLFDLAVKAGVDHYIWSSLPNVTKMTQGKLKEVIHFDGKNRVEQYIRERLLSQEAGVKNASFVYPGIYMENFTGMMKPSKNDQGVVTWYTPLSEDALLPACDIGHDFGNFVLRLLDDPVKYRGQVLEAVGEMTTPKKMIQDFTELTGVPAVYQQGPWPQLSDDLREMFEFYNMKLWNATPGPNTNTWKDYLKRVGFKG